MDSSKICYILVVLASLALVIYGFMDLLKRKTSEENDLEVIQRQLRGFAMIMLAQIVLVLGLSGCVGLAGGLGDIQKAIRSLK